MTELLVATSNPHKLDEIRAILEPMNVRVLGLADINVNGAPGAELPPPDESGATFEDNARIKALAYARMTGRICLADDSGLEVDALDGAPGVHSAYFAHGREGEHLPRAERDSANNDRLLEELHDVPRDDRAARFVCVMCLAAPDGRVLAMSEGDFEGRIGFAPRGANGFGYDPLLVIEDGRTSAELTPEEKNARSHRGAAARAMAHKLADALARA